MSSPGARSWRRWALGLLAALLWVVPLVAVPLLDPDEGRYGEIPREMLASGDFVTPRLAGTLYLEKPPLHYWLTAAALRALGRTELAVRLWSALLGLGTAALLYLLARDLAGRRTALAAAGLLLASPFFFSLAHVATLDMTLTFFVTLALAGFWVAHEGPPGHRARLGWAALFGGSALAVMTKGLVGLVLPGGVIFLYLLLAGRWCVLRAVPWVGGTALFLALAAPWHLAVARRNPSFVQFYFVHEHFLRYATPVAERGEPVWYFLLVLAVGCLPWIGALALVARLRGGHPLRAWMRERPDLLFLACWIGFVLAFFSASHSKLPPYVLPVAPPLALLAALGLAEARRSGRAWSAGERLGLGAGAAVALTVALAGAVAVCGLLPASVRPLGEVHAFHPLALALCLAAAAASAWVLARSARAGGLSATAPATESVTAPLLAATALLTAAIWSLAAIEAPTRSSKAIAAYLASRLEPGDRVICVGGYRQSLPFYLDRLVGSAEPHKDLAFGVSQLPAGEERERFPTTAELKALWDSEQRVYVVVDRELERLRSRGLAGGTVLLPGKRMQLVVNHLPKTS